MKLNKNVATFISLLLGVACAIVIYNIAPTPSYSAQGIFLPNQQNSSAPYQGDIKVLTLYPAHYRLLGVVHIEHHKTPNELSAEKGIVTFAKSMTRSQGGNAIVIQNFGATLPESNASGLASFIFNGAVIYEY